MCSYKVQGVKYEVVKEKIRVAVADDNRDFMSVVEEYFKEQPDIEIVGMRCV